MANLGVSGGANASLQKAEGAKRKGIYKIKDEINGRISERESRKGKKKTERNKWT